MIEETFLTHFKEGVSLFAAMINWPFVVFNMIWVVIIQTVDKKIHQKKKRKSNIRLFLDRIPRTYYVILQSVTLAVAWTYFFRFETREQVAELFISITAAMIAWKLGFHKLLFRKQANENN